MPENIITVPPYEFPKATGICQNCMQRPATELWVGEGGTLAITHGMYANWCKICCLRVQVEHMTEIASRLPVVEKELAELLEQEKLK